MTQKKQQKNETKSKTTTTGKSAKASPEQGRPAKSQPERSMSQQADRPEGGLKKSDDSTAAGLSPFGFMSRFNREIDRLFGDLGFGGFRSPQSGIGSWSDTDKEFAQMAQWAPQTEVFERGDQILVRADLPGMTKDDIDVELEDGRIIIQGERRDERRSDEHGFSERSYGSFYRSIPMPKGIDADKAKADFKNGLLVIELPKPQSAETRKRLEIGKGADTAPQSRAKSAGGRA